MSILTLKNGKSTTSTFPIVPNLVEGKSQQKKEMITQARHTRAGAPRRLYSTTAIRGRWHVYNARPTSPIWGMYRVMGPADVSGQPRADLTVKRYRRKFAPFPLGR